ncbi:hypothetical protein MTO96_024854 [Rhipicephalus appendiculatus]
MTIRRAARVDDCSATRAVWQDSSTCADSVGLGARAHRVRCSTRHGCALGADHQLLGGVPARGGGANRWSGVPPRRRTAAGALRSPFTAVSRKTWDKSSSPFPRTPRELSGPVAWEPLSRDTAGEGREQLQPRRGARAPRPAERTGPL